MTYSRWIRGSKGLVWAAVAVVTATVLGTSGSAFGQTFTYSAMQFTTVNSASWTLKGMNGNLFSTPLVETLGTTTDLNQIGTTLTDVRTLNSSVNPDYVGNGDMYFEAWHQNLSWPGVANWDYDYFGFTSNMSNTGYWIEAVFNVTFASSVTFETGSSGYTNYPNVSVNGTALNRYDVLAAGTYTFTWDYNNLSAGSNSGELFGLFFSGNAPAAVPGSGLAAIGSLGLAGLARRRRR